ncbi:MAG: response regulator [Bacillota bacterium]|jgi:two-component system response regulator YesN
MLKIMIVDDEPLERQAIRMILENYRPKYRIVGEAGDGEEAVEVARRVKPEVILLDIKMPGLSGIEVAHILRPELPSTRLVIVSAYGEFDYAKQAVTLGISEYLLKPVDTEELVVLLDRLYEEIKAEQESVEEMEKLRAALQDVMPLIRVGFVMDVINGSLTNEEETRARAELLGIHQPLRVVLHIWIDNLTGHHSYRSELENQILQKQIQEVVQEVLCDWPGALEVPVGNGQYVVLLPADISLSEEKLKEATQQLGDNICCLVRSRTGATVTVGIGRPAKRSEGLAFSHAQALAAGEYRALYGGDQAIHADDVMAASGAPSLLKQENGKSMALAIRMGDGEKVRQSFLGLWSQMLQEEEFHPADVRMKLLEVTALASRAAVEGGVDSEQVGVFSFPSELQEGSVDGLTEIRDQVVRWLDDLVARVRASREFRNSNLVEKAIQYVDENYHQELSLEDVARQVYLSPCYFSRLFKQVKGLSFSEYLTQVRMEEARRLLLHTDLLVSEIATRVGYRDARYFSQVFKKAEGSTPVNFRRDISKQL